MGRVVRLCQADAAMTALPVEALPEDAPAILTYAPGAARSVREMVAKALDAMEAAAVELFPAWLPEAEGIDGPGGAAVIAVRALASRAASATRHYGPFLADLAETSLRGATRPPSRFAPEVRAAGLAQVLAAGFKRPRAAVLVRVPEGLTAFGEEVLVAGCEWLTGHGGLGVWLAGAPLRCVDRVGSVTLRFPGRTARRSAREEVPAPARALTYPAVAGTPHPASRAEKALERALSSRPWSCGRAWNQTYRPHPLAAPIRVDLVWRDERCVVEIDGDGHRGPERYEADRRRDVRLQLDGYAVLRFTNAQVLTDVESVVGQVERFLRGRRGGTSEGTRRA